MATKQTDVKKLLDEALKPILARLNAIEAKLDAIEPKDAIDKRFAELRSDTENQLAAIRNSLPRLAELMPTRPDPKYENPPKRQKGRGPVPFAGLPVELRVEQRFAKQDAERHPEFDAKKRQVVRERILEQPTSEEDKTYLKKLIQKVVANPDLGIQDSLDKFWRHETRNSTASRKPRIVKVAFKSAEAARKFLLNFRRLAGPMLTDLKPVPFARRDMTPPELSLQTKLRTYIFSLNKEHNKSFVFYRDLNVYYRDPG